MELDELSGHITGRLVYTGPTTTPTPFEGRDTMIIDYLCIYRRTHSLSVMCDVYGPDKAAGAWAPQQLPPGQQDLFVTPHIRRMELNELLGRTKDGHEYNEPTTAYAIRGTAELALRYSIISASTAGPIHYHYTTKQTTVYDAIKFCC